MIKLRLSVLIVVITGIFNSLAWADTTSIPIIKKEEIKQGMKGYGLTVFKGDKPQRFEFEVLGIDVLPDGRLGRAPLVLAELSGGPEGHKMEYIGPSQGQSGTPLILETDKGDRLLGSLMSGVGFDKDAVVRVQLAETMLNGARAFENGNVHPSTGFLSSQYTIPVNFSGPFFWSKEVDNLFNQKNLQVNYYSFQGESTKPKWQQQAELELGEAINVYLAIGDLNFGVNGTVSILDGNTFYAFAHPIFGTGHTSLPVTKARILKTVANQYISYRYAQQSSEFIGVVDLDCAWGIKGTLGKKAKMIPVSYTVKDGAVAEEYNTWVADVDGPTNWIIQMFTYYVLQGGYRKFNMGSRGDKGSTSVKITLEVNELPNAIEMFPYVITYDRTTVFTKFSAYQKGLLKRVLDVLSDNDLTLRSISFDIEYFTEYNFLELVSAEFDSNRVVTNDTVNLSLVLQSRSNVLERYETSIPLVIPSDIGHGNINVTISTGDLSELKDYGKLPVGKALNKILLFDNTRIFIKMNANNIDMLDQDRETQKIFITVNNLEWEINSLEQKTLFKSILLPVNHMAINANKILKLYVLSKEDFQKEKDKQKQEKIRKIEEQLKKFEIKQ